MWWNVLCLHPVIAIALLVHAVLTETRWIWAKSRRSHGLSALDHDGHTSSVARFPTTVKERFFGFSFRSYLCTFTYSRVVIYRDGSWSVQV